MFISENQVWLTRNSAWLTRIPALVNKKSGPITPKIGKSIKLGRIFCQRGFGVFFTVLKVFGYRHRLKLPGLNQFPLGAETTHAI